MTYGELPEHVASIGARLARVGIGYGSRVLCVLDRSATGLLTLLALSDLQATVALVPPDHPVSRTIKDAQRTKCQYVLISGRTEHALEAAVPTWTWSRHSDLGLVAETGTHARPLLGRDGLPLHMIARSSGTTGEPKYICLGQGTKIARAKSFASTFQLTGHDRLLVSTPLEHTLVHRGLFTSLQLGATFAFLERYSPSVLRRDLQDSGANVMMSVAAQVRSLLAAQSDAKESHLPLKMLISSSSPLFATEKIHAKALVMGEFRDTYGTSETAVATHSIVLDDDTAQDVGAPVKGAEIRIVGGEGGGTIEVRSKQVFDGYLGKDGEISSYFSQHEWFSTGDLGEIRPDGRLRFKGREGDQINVGGYNVDPLEVEAALRPGIHSHFAVTAVDHPVLGEVPVLCVVGDDNRSTARSIQAWARKVLDAQEVPHQVIFVQELPTTEALKLDRKSLREVASGLAHGSH